MSDATPSRLGQANLTGGTDALFIKVFSGEVMSTFASKTVMNCQAIILYQQFAGIWQTLKAKYSQMYQSESVSELLFNIYVTDFSSPYISDISPQFQLFS